MPVTELAVLSLKLDCTLDVITPRLRRAGSLQGAVAGYPVHFFFHKEGSDVSGSVLAGDVKHTDYDEH
jgi:hypothetical protein